MTDPIADLLTRIRNAYLAKHNSVELPHSRVKEAVAKILEREGYIASLEAKKGKPQAKLILTLKYRGKLPMLTGIERVSKPGRRIYVRAHKVPRTLGEYGTTILSTSQGIMTDKEAKKAKVGGEVLCKVW